MSLYRLQTMSLRRTVPSGTRISTVRRAAYHSTTPLRYPYKDDQDKDSLKPRSSEYSQSSSDEAAAAQDQAFDPNKTSPEEQQTAADIESGDVSRKPQKSDNNPLEMSPANKGSSQARDPEEGGATRAPGENEGSRNRTSTAGSAKKYGGNK